MDVDVVVIGSGAGGLAAAVALARCGKKVHVLEQHYLPGGWCHSFSLDGFQFSPGVHYIGDLGPDGGIRTIYEGLGVANDLEFLELNPDGYDHLRIGEERFDVPKGREVYAARLKERFPQQARAIEQWFSLVDRIGSELDAGVRAEGLLDFVQLPLRIPTLMRFGLRTVDAMLDRCGVRDPVLRGFLTIQSGDHGMPPDRCPMVLHAAVVHHYFDGAWYPKGGGKALPKAFIRALRAHGGEITLSAKVERILVEGGRAIGVRLADGQEIRASLVVSNADPGVTFGRLLAPEDVPWRLRRRLQRTRWSVSALSLFLATDLDLDAAGLDSGNYWYSLRPGFDDAWAYANRPDPLEAELPGLFLTATTLKDRTKRRDRLHTLEAFTFVSPEAFRPWADSTMEDRPEGYQALKEALADRMLARLDDIVPGLSDRLVFREVGSPLTNIHYAASTNGSLYGTEKSRFEVGPFGWPLKTPIEGLWCCGASTTGHGVAGATISGLLAARAILGCGMKDILTAKQQHLRTRPCDPPQQEAPGVAAVV